jgi:signal transduction histidine kinase
MATQCRFISAREIVNTATKTYFWLADAEGRLQDADDTLAELLGYSRAELLDLAAGDIEPGLVLQPFAKAVRRAAHYRMKDGSEIGVTCRTRYLEASGGQYVTFVEESASACKPPFEDDRAVLPQLILNAQCSNIVLFNLDSEVIWLNKSACLSSGRDFSDLIGSRCHQLWSYCGDKPCRNCLVQDVIASGKIEQRKMTMIDDRRWRVTGIPIFDDTGTMEYVLFLGDDITEYLTIAKEARQSHKLESLGTLAGGIAHDFNNILSGIVGYTELSLAIAPEGGPLRNYLLELAQAGKRATELVRQILTFSRRGEGKLVATELPIIVKEVLQLLRSTLPTTIELRKNIDSNVNPVLADPVQIHQIIMNLCTNASHAMEPYGGILTVTIQSAALPARFFEHNKDLLPGDYLLLSVSDTGRGMSQEVMASIFEPYFTTKPPGQGTGLGLSVVHGIVKDCGGYITVDSVPGQGSTFTIYFPTVERSINLEAGSLTLGRLSGTETIMVVDDEPVVLNVTKTFLELQGYKVLTETNSQVALNKFRDDPQSIDLLISDVTMPHLTGDRLARECLAIRPDLPIILMTGYTDLVTEQSAKRDGIRALIMKPLVGKTFLSQVRHLLDIKRTFN